MTTYRLPGAGFVAGGQQYYEQESLQGSVLSTRVASAALKSHTQYDAYGVEYLPWESAPGALGGQRFAGQRGYQNDGATGMRLLGARYYLPALGRFLTPDRIGHAGGLNLYAYGGDSPLLKVDPDGKDWASFSNFLVGVGDGVSFGGTKHLRKWIGEGLNIGDANQSVEYDSGWYAGGKFGGEVLGTYLTGSAAGAAWRAGRTALGLSGNAWRIGGAGTRASHWLRIEAGNVHLIPGVKESAVNVLHFHLALFENVPRLAGLAKLHLPYQLWPTIQGARGAQKLWQTYRF